VDPRRPGWLHDRRVNRRTLDVLIPMAYAAAIMAAVFAFGGKVTAAVAAIGAILVGAYFAALRRNLPS
jgi:hypothetical protein